MALVVDAEGKFEHGLGRGVKIYANFGWLRLWRVFANACFARKKPVRWAFAPVLIEFGSDARVAGVVQACAFGYSEQSIF
ncbi:hypothetical protein [Rhizobium sp. 18065]|uniref:hypothetical protein n=1 Tax=Rhizobium sp. 18065 TaxID=2681411 RepID=UPI00135CC03E|nr:hypothetical protein [Rhizobium sp. 18065]